MAKNEFETRFKKLLTELVKTSADLNELTMDVHKSGKTMQRYRRLQRIKIRWQQSRTLRQREEKARGL